MERARNATPVVYMNNRRADIDTKKFYQYNAQIDCAKRLSTHSRTSPAA